MGDEASEEKVVTKQLLEKAIGRLENRTDLIVKEFSVEPASNIGDNFATILFRVIATIQDGAVVKARHLIIKVPHSKGMYREMIINMGLFEKEVFTYSTVVPLLIGFQRELGVVPLEPPVPIFYDGYEDKEQMMGVLILEDLRLQGYEMSDKTEGVDLQHCKLVMKGLAKMHSLSVALKNKDPVRLKEKLPIVFHNAMLTDFDAINRPLLENAKTKALEVTAASSHDEEFKARARKLMDGDPLDVIKSTLTQPCEPFGVVCHGDFWCNNMLFRYEDVDGAKVPVDVKFVDFQIIGYALPSTDLIYFFLTSTTRNLRKAHMVDLLRLYHSEFMRTLDHVKFDFSEFTFEVLHEMFKKTATFGLICAFTVLPVILANVSAHEKHGTQANEEDLINSMTTALHEKLDERSAAIINERLLGAVEDAVEMSK